VIDNKEDFNSFVAGMASEENYINVQPTHYTVDSKSIDGGYIVYLFAPYIHLWSDTASPNDDLYEYEYEVSYDGTIKLIKKTFILKNEL